MAECTPTWPKGNPAFHYGRGMFMNIYGQQLAGIWWIESVPAFIRKYTVSDIFDL